MENQTQPQPQPVQDTLRKVDQAMARLQEIQCTISGGSILCGGVALSPRSTRGYLRTSLRCKQESLRLKELAMIVDEETNPDKGQQIVRSSSLRRSSSNGEWRRWSTPAFLIQQAVGEIMEASNLTKEVAHLVSNSIEDKPTESPKSEQSSLNGISVVDEQNEFSYHSNDEKCSLNETERQHTDFGEKAGLQTFGPNLPENPVHSFKVIYKDTSTLKHHRKIEKEEYATRVRAESPNPNTRFQRQMSFRASDQVKKQGRTKKIPSSLPVSHCSSPVRLIREKTTSAKPLVKVEQIKPATNSWMSRSSSTKAIMFRNSAFVPSPLKNNQEDKSTNASMKRNSLPCVKDMKSLRTTDYPCNKEEHSGVCMVADSPTVRKSSSFSRMSRSSSTKAIVFPNSGFAPSLLKNNQEDKSTNASMKRNSLPSFKDLKSLRTTHYPCTKEEHSGVHMVADSPTVRKSSSFSWIPRSSPTKAIMSPNPAFVSFPLRNNLQVESTNASTKRNSLPSVQDLRSLRFTDYPCNREEHSEVCMVTDSPTVRKSSSFSWIPRSSSTKAKMFCNPAFVSSPLNNPQVESANASLKRNSLPSVKELESLRITDFPCNKEDHSEVRMVSDSPTVRKSSSFSWMSRSSSTKAAMFSNPAFVSFPSKNNPEIKCTNASMKSNSLPFVKDLKSLRTADYPCNKEEHSRVCTAADSPTVKKSSSFSAAYQHSASNLTKQSPMSSLLNRTLKKLHVTKASTPGSPQTPSEFDAKTRFEATPGLEKSTSLRFVSSSQKQDSLVRRHSMASCDPSAESKVSRLSKQPIKALVQLPKKITSVILHPHSVPLVGDIGNESIVTSETGEGHRMRKLSEFFASSAEDVRKQGAKRVEGHNKQSNLPINSVNVMQHGRHVQKCNRSPNYTKERHLRPISNNSSLNSSSRHENNTGSFQEMLYATPSKDKLKKQKIKLHRKENSDNEEDKGMKKSTGFLRNSWSFTPDNRRSSHKEKLDAATGRLPFLKNVKEWVTLQRSVSSINR